MKNTALVIVSVLLSISVFPQAEGIKKGDKEVNMSGTVTYVKIGESDFSSTSGFAIASFGRYLTDRLLIGIAPGMSVTQYGNEDAELDYNVQLFTNFNLINKKLFMPYLRATIYESSFKREESTYLQAGGGIKLFFSERASWDSQLTYGFNVSGGEGSTILFLTGISYIF